jgi:transcriptional regulator with XRE-family HTH domain
MTKNKTSANMVDIVVGTNLRMMRTSVKMSQTVLADKVNITFQQIQKYERGDNRIGASRLWEFCKIFDCKPNAFFVGVEGEASSEAEAVLDAQRTDLYQHPRGPAIASAFLKINNRDIENQIIAMCRTLAK